MRHDMRLNDSESVAKPDAVPRRPRIHGQDKAHAPSASSTGHRQLDLQMWDSPGPVCAVRLAFCRRSATQMAVPVVVAVWLLSMAVFVLQSQLLSVTTKVMRSRRMIIWISSVPDKQDGESRSMRIGARSDNAPGSKAQRTPILSMKEDRDQ